MNIGPFEKGVIVQNSKRGMGIMRRACMSLIRGQNLHGTKIYVAVGRGLRLIESRG